MKRLLLLLIPIFTLAVSIVFIRQLSPFYMSLPDPTYIHLFNGINLAGGHMEVGNTDNPGTTVQCFAAIVIFFKHLFSGSQVSLYQDVLLHPENYLMACSTALILLVVFVNYLSGAYIYKHTGNIGLSMMFQVTPFFNMNILQRAIVLEPEAMIIITSMFFMAYLYVKAPEGEISSNKNLSNSVLIIFGLFSGFLIASKYTCSPVVLLVLFMLQNNRQRLFYALTAIISFFVFILPAIAKLKNMYQWVWNLFTHDGIYGKGQARIIDPSQYRGKLEDIVLTDTIFTSIYALITVAFLVAVFGWLRRRGTIPFARTITGIWLSITVLILIVAKHFDFHYFVPAECVFPLGIVVAYKIISATLVNGRAYFKKHERKIIYPLAVLFVVFMLIEKIRYLPVRHPQPVLTEKYTELSEKEPLLIAVNSSTECERLELSLYLGYLFSGNQQGKYAQFLNRVYPNSYIFWNGSDSILHWGKEMPLSDFVTNNNKVKVYMKGFNDSDKTNLMCKLCVWTGNAPAEGYRTEEEFKDNGTLQDIYLIERNSIKPAL